MTVTSTSCASPRCSASLTRRGPKKPGKKTVKKVENGQETTTEKDFTLLDTTVLIGTAGLDKNVYLSGRNIEGVKVLPAAEFNCYTVLKHRQLLLTRAALDALRAMKVERRPAKEAVAAGK